MDLTAELQSRILTMEMRCYYSSHTKTMLPNKKSMPRSQQVIRPYKDLWTIVKRHKMKWYRHVSRSSGPAKTILQGTLKREEDDADRKRGGRKTISGNGQAWSPRGQWRTQKNGGEMVVQSSALPQ